MKRDRIRAAMDRIMTDNPQRSNCALTIVALALEADVPRNALTQRHPDLKNQFYEKVRALGQTPDSEARLRERIRKLRQLHDKDAEELCSVAERPATPRPRRPPTHRGNRQLRTELATPDARVRVLPTQPRPARTS
jgi:hypothetical protein